MQVEQKDLHCGTQPLIIGISFANYWWKKIHFIIKISGDYVFLDWIKHDGHVLIDNYFSLWVLWHRIFYFASLANFVVDMFENVYVSVQILWANIFWVFPFSPTLGGLLISSTKVPLFVSVRFILTLTPLPPKPPPPQN